MEEDKVNQANQAASSSQTVVFAQEDTLGKVVSEKKLISNLGVGEILNFKRRLQFSCGFDKLGFLCGFKFVSNRAEAKNKTFLVVFVPKLKSKIMRQQVRGRSSWYIWEYINSTEVNVLSQASALSTYGFDIDLFFKSDLFKLAVPKFVKAVEECLRTQVADHMKKLESSEDGYLEAKELVRYIRAIQDSLPTLKDSQNASGIFNLGNSSDGESKVYRANKSYELDHFQKRQQLDQLKADFKAWLATKDTKSSTKSKES